MNDRDFYAWRLLALTLLLAAALAAAAGCSLAQKPETAAALVERVVDGDTIHVVVNGQKETVRMLLVDTPETKHPDKPVEPFGPEASEFAKERLEGRTVRLEFDGPKRDKYDRLLAYVWIDDVLFNELLVENGLARLAYVYDPPYRHYNAIAAAENRAMKEKKGIWSIENYVREDGFDSERAASYWKEREAASVAMAVSSEAGSREKEAAAGEAHAGEAAAGEEGGASKGTAAAAEAPACDNPLIKGNISSRGDKIYHLPGGQYYEQTKAERMFCSVEEAVAAGFRAAMR
jgi:micrococcal nuclease